MKWWLAFRHWRLNRRLRSLNRRQLFLDRRITALYLAKRKLFDDGFKLGMEIGEYERRERHANKVGTDSSAGN